MTAFPFDKVQARFDQPVELIYVDPVQDPLTPADYEVLEFARATWKHRGRREAVILERFGYTLTRYIQRLHHILDHPDAAAYDAQLVNQLRRLESKRAAHRNTLNRGVL